MEILDFQLKIIHSIIRYRLFILEKPFVKEVLYELWQIGILLQKFEELEKCF